MSNNTIWQEVKGSQALGVFNEEDQKASRRDLARRVILHEYPLAIVDHVGFQDFVGALRPNFKIVGRRDIKKIYNEKKQKTMVEIDKKRSFMVITTHYISDSSTLESRILRYFFSLGSFCCTSF